MASNTSPFRPDSNESERHRLAKATLEVACEALGWEAYPECPIDTPYKTYFCDVLAIFTFLNHKIEIKLDLEIEDHDHSKHDFADSINKAKELSKICIKTIWLKSHHILAGAKTHPKPRKIDEICYAILSQMADTKTVDPRLNL